ncbi:MAG TPA: alpha/beta hydrolase [Chthoniobacteraceae bacterium]|nr:alpha/beta hydrolase [Chthoniobacteraceae bacterium]
METFRDAFIDARDGTRLFVRTGAPSGQAKGTVVITHGRGEHSGRYIHVASALMTHGFAVALFDLRGHGRSSGRRGDLPGYASLLDDLGCVLQRTCVDAAVPMFLFGHSLGGQIVLNYLIRNEEKNCRGAVVASPYLRLAFRPERWRVALAGILRRTLPAITLRTFLAPSRLSRDEAHLVSLPDHDLIHHRISSRMFDAIEQGAAAALTGAPRMHVPLLLIHGANDSVTSVEATREFFDAAGAEDKTLQIFPGMLHETHNDLGREQVIDTIVRWIAARC